MVFGFREKKQGIPKSQNKAIDSDQSRQTNNSHFIVPRHTVVFINLSLSNYLPNLLYQTNIRVEIISYVVCAFERKQHQLDLISVDRKTLLAGDTNDNSPILLS